MYYNSKYEKILLRLGWHQISSTLWSIKNDDSESVLCLDLSKDKKGVFSFKDGDGQSLQNDFIEEFDEAVIFRRKQYEIDSGVPQEYWEIGV